MLHLDALAEKEHAWVAHHDALVDHQQDFSTWFTVPVKTVWPHVQVQ
jgi:hypothetical protein